MTSRPLRIAFMGTPDFALEALRFLCEETPHELVCVYSQPPRPKGRGHKVQKSPVHDYADQRTIPVFTPQSLKKEAEQQEFIAHNVDVAIVAAYGLILPKIVLDAPRFGCLNIHASLLPRWRGAAPIQYALWSGDTQTGITIMQMDEGLDTGPVIAEKPLPITSTCTASSLHDDLAALGASMIAETLQQLADAQNHLSAEPQGEDFTYAPMLKKQDGQIDWSASAISIDRQIRALNPWPGVTTTCGAHAFKIKHATLIDGTAGQGAIEAGTIVNKQGDIVCGDGKLLRLFSIQPAGKKPMDFAAVLNGGYVHVGKIFS